MRTAAEHMNTSAAATSFDIGAVSHPIRQALRSPLRRHEIVVVGAERETRELR